MSDSQSGAGKMIRLLIADDHPVTRNGMALLLASEDDMTVEAQASDGVEAVTLYRIYKPDVAVLDLQMPRLSGFEATTRILEEFPRARILVFTTYDGDEDIDRAMHAGARGFLLKDAKEDELVLAIRTIHRGARYVSPPVGAKLLEAANGRSLTERERQVLRLLAQGLSNKEIAFQVNVSESTVKTHVAAVIEKLGVGSRTEAALAAVRRGFLRY